MGRVGQVVQGVIGLRLHASWNIGPVARSLLEAVGEPADGLPVAPFANDRLISESRMERHPLGPTTDPGFQRWLARQTWSRVGHLPLTESADGRVQAAA